MLRLEPFQEQAERRDGWNLKLEGLLSDRFTTTLIDAVSPASCSTHCTSATEMIGCPSSETISSPGLTSLPGTALRVQEAVRSRFTRVVRADPGRAGLLYAGTERGVYVSLDDGASWQSLQ